MFASNKGNKQTITKSLHPWYYAPGNHRLTEKRISAKREKESQEQLKNEEMKKYYNKCNLESKLFSNWDQNRPLVRYHQKDEESFNSPFYTETTFVKEWRHKCSNETLKQLSTLYNEYKQSTIKYNDNLIDSNTILGYMQNFFKHYRSIMCERALKMVTINRYLYDSYRTSHDPLRHVCFLVRELLFCYHEKIINIMQLSNSFYSQDFLSDSEKADLKQVNSRCIQIINMYIQLNETRNNNFLQMFDEEKKNIWLEQKSLWQDEIAIWDCLVVNLLRSNYHLIREKFEQHIKLLKELLRDRIIKFDQLKYFIEEIKHDDNLKDFIYIDINKLEEI